MVAKKDSPGIYIPPPLFYVAIFLVALWLQAAFPIDKSFFESIFSKVAGYMLLAISVLYFGYRSLRQFYKTKNTVITFKEAHSLQTTGIYAITRNPMYAGLCIAYLGFTLAWGNWWNVVLFPGLIIVVQEYIIKREEKYLERKFGEPYLIYKSKVGRWF